MKNQNENSTRPSSPRPHPLLGNADFPEVPPGVRTFSARRFRRVAGSRRALSTIRRTEREKEIAEHEKREMMKRLGEAQRREAAATNRLSRELSKGFFARLKGVFTRKST
jgi:hypothetical protein